MQLLCVSHCWHHLLAPAGRVPPYLLDRKLAMAEEAAAAVAAAAPRDCPEGTHILPEEERVQVSCSLHVHAMRI